ncbi:hypothetical protein EXE46_05730 [Halorubrum sp. GN11_10-6_MGM]|uniref:hypothetical protein n=1 Tax=Halorubrum sp. GN11_10-6_MGM TaxID=2518112 RepID=UPI0010F4DC23|nr:hypothetical protein [Halorubrum sp. GN11_10-6_MGM]TKX75119.1 hypothetical protein EXE46_05730 [Halorubrum sp. GN11_10-6_MGM]
MAAAIHTPSVEATVTVRVSQAAAGDLAAGARAQIERIDGLRVEEIEIAGLRPGLNDTTVEAVATLAVGEEAAPESASDDAAGIVADRVRERLADGFGVDPERVERVDPPD